MKKYFKVLFLVLFLALSFVFVGCGGNDTELSDKERNDFIKELGGASETFKGAISDVAFISKEDTVNAYLNTEIAGESSAKVVEVNTKAVLDEEAINKLDIPAEDKEGIVEVEEVEVTYKETSFMYSSKDGDKEVKKVTVIIIKYETDWKYFVPAPITGETISKSYYDSVFASEKFKNCTYVYEMELDMDMKASYQGESQSAAMKMTATQEVKYAEGKIFLNTTMSYVMEGVGGFNEEETVCAYIEEVDGILYCYIKMNGEWQETNLINIGFYNLDELAPFANDYLDYSYFTKTDFGFKLDEENAQSYIDQVFAEAGIGDMLGGGDLDMSMYAEYYVNQGALSGLLLKAKMNMNASESGVSIKMNGDITAKATCKDYGTTTVEKPF